MHFNYAFVHQYNFCDQIFPYGMDIVIGVRCLCENTLIVTHILFLISFL